MQTAIDLKSMAKHEGPFGAAGDSSPNVDARALAEELRGRIRGEVRFDDGSRA